MSDLFGNHTVGFLMVGLICYIGYESLTQRVIVNRDTTTHINIQLNKEMSNLQYHDYADIEKYLRNITRSCHGKAQLHR